MFKNITITLPKFDERKKTCFNARTGEVFQIPATREPVGSSFYCGNAGSATIAGIKENLEMSAFFFGYDRKRDEKDQEIYRASKESDLIEEYQARFEREIEEWEIWELLRGYREDCDLLKAAWTKLGFSHPTQIPSGALSAIAEKLGVSKQFISKVYNGERPLPEEMAEKLANF